jgi:hypothetical protein
MFTCHVEGSNDIELPGRATLHWDTPCQSPSPTLAVALVKLALLVGPTP